MTNFTTPVIALAIFLALTAGGLGTGHQQKQGGNIAISVVFARQVHSVEMNAGNSASPAEMAGASRPATTITTGQGTWALIGSAAGAVVAALAMAGELLSRRRNPDRARRQVTVRAS